MTPLLFGKNEDRNTLLELPSPDISSGLADGTQLKKLKPATVASKIKE
ncbi:hypothetical protein FHS86_001710 [Roseimarinus sediminis]